MRASKPAPLAYRLAGIVVTLPEEREVRISPWTFIHIMKLIAWANAMVPGAKAIPDEEMHELALMELHLRRQVQVSLDEGGYTLKFRKPKRARPRDAAWLDLVRERVEAINEGRPRAYRFPA
jgi:hypothetical protein